MVTSWTARGWRPEIAAQQTSTGRTAMCGVFSLGSSSCATSLFKQCRVQGDSGGKREAPTTLSSSCAKFNFLVLFWGSEKRLIYQPCGRQGEGDGLLQRDVAAQRTRMGWSVMRGPSKCSRSSVTSLSKDGQVQEDGGRDGRD
jgi:hypothetical protein